MTKPPKKSERGKQQPSDDEILLRMLNTPPKPHKSNEEKRKNERPRKGKGSKRA